MSVGCRQLTGRMGEVPPAGNTGPAMPGMTYIACSAENNARYCRPPCPLAGRGTVEIKLNKINAINKRKYIKK